MTVAIKHYLFWLVIILAIAGMTAAALLYRGKPAQAPADESALPGAGGSLNQSLDDATRLPTIDVQTDPLGNLPDVNPVEQANPFSDLNTNPFR